MHGFIVVDKPAGMTSHDVVARLRRILGMKKIGHTGTLDPFATGVLPVALGEGTKAIPFLDEGVKEYRAVMRLGITTDTDDLEGRITLERPLEGIDDALIRETFPLFTGELSQIPPMYSALKRNGVPLYKLARRGEEVEREPRRLTVYSLVIDRIEFPFVTFTVRCSRGTYVRALARDLGEQLGCGAHLTALRRNASGPFTLADAQTLEQLADQRGAGTLPAGFVSLSAALGHLTPAVLTPEGARRLRCGMLPTADDLTAPLPASAAGCRILFTFDGAVVAVAEAVQEEETLRLRLLRGFN